MTESPFAPNSIEAERKATQRRTQSRVMRATIIISLVAIVVGGVAHRLAYNTMVWRAYVDAYNETANIAKMCDSVLCGLGESDEDKIAILKNVVGVLGFSKPAFNVLLMDAEGHITELREDTKGAELLDLVQLRVHHTKEPLPLAELRATRIPRHETVLDPMGNSYLITFHYSEPIDGHVVTYQSRDKVKQSAHQAIMPGMITSLLCLLLVMPAGLCLLYVAYRRAARDAEEQQSELDDRETRWRQIFEENDAAKMIIEPDTRTIIHVNQAAGLLYGYEPAQLCDESLEFLSVEPCGAVRSIGGNSSREAQLERHKDCNGEPRYIEVHRSPVLYEGQAMEFQILHDVTDERLIERRFLHLVEEEQRRLGQDIHDGISQHLAGASLWANGVWDDVRSGRAPAEEDVATLRKLVKEALVRSRKMAMGLGPVDSADWNLEIVLKRLCSMISDAFNVKCTSSYKTETDVVDLRTRTLIQIHHMVQDLMYYAARVEGASTICIECSMDQITDMIEVVIEYNICPDRASEGRGIPDTLAHRASLEEARIERDDAASGCTRFVLRFLNDPSIRYEQSKRESNGHHKRHEVLSGCAG